MRPQGRYRRSARQTAHGDANVELLPHSRRHGAQGTIEPDLFEILHRLRDREEITVGRGEGEHDDAGLLVQDVVCAQSERPRVGRGQPAIEGRAVRPIVVAVVVAEEHARRLAAAGIHLKKRLNELL